MVKLTKAKDGTYGFRLNNNIQIEGIPTEKQALQHVARIIKPFIQKILDAEEMLHLEDFASKAFGKNSGTSAVGGGRGRLWQRRPGRRRRAAPRDDRLGLPERERPYLGVYFTIENGTR